MQNITNFYIMSILDDSFTIIHTILSSSSREYISYRQLPGVPFTNTDYL